MSEPRDLLSRTTPEIIYKSREAAIDEAGKHIAKLLSAKRRMSLWNGARKYLAVAPLATSTILLTSRLENWDSEDKITTLAFSAAAAAVGFTAGEIMHDRNAKKMSEEAIDAGLILSELGLPNPPVVNEGINQILGPDSLIDRT